MYQFGVRIEKDMSLAYICLDCERTYSDLDAFAVECMGAPLVCTPGLLRQAKSIVPLDDTSEERELEHYISMSPSQADREWRNERVYRQLFNPLSVHQRSNCSYVTHVRLPGSVLAADPSSVWALVKAALGGARDVWVSSDRGALGLAVVKPIMELRAFFKDAYRLSTAKGVVLPAAFEPMDPATPIPVAIPQHMIDEFSAYSPEAFASRLRRIYADICALDRASPPREAGGMQNGMARAPSMEGLVQLVACIARTARPARSHAYWWLYSFYLAMANGSYHIVLEAAMSGYGMQEMYQSIVPLVFKHMRPLDFVYALRLPRLDPVLDAFCANVRMLAPDEYVALRVPPKLRVWTYGLTKPDLTAALASMGASIETAPRGCYAGETRVLRALCKRYRSCIVGAYDIII
jgi:hypothetical protein